MKKLIFLRNFSTITFTIIISIFFSGCSKSDTDPVPPPEARFTYSAKGSYPVTVTFINTSTSSGSPAVAWNWNFGDATTSNLQNPVHSYTSGGTYMVRFSQSLASGAMDTAVKIVTIPTDLTVTSGSSGRSLDTQTSDFVFNVGSLSAPFTVTFTNTSVNATGNVWNFGDGATISSNASLVTHVYAATGTYHVVLTSTNAGGTDTTGAVINLN